MTYPEGIPNSCGARIASVEVGSPASRAGLEPGVLVLSADGEPLGDILDWFWLADGFEVELEVAREVASEDVLREAGFDLVGETELDAPREMALDSDFDSDNLLVSTCVLTRQPGEGWGINFDEVLFDGLRSCVNNCIFCFMKMLPEGMRASMYVRDDDYRLSFLHGNFVTLTNLDDDDIARIKEMHLSPLNVSLHAVRPEVRRHMMGAREARGIEALEELLAEGIEFKAQIVLMPGVNDGAVLTETLDWIKARPGIVATGIVPYGYTRYAAVQRGFDTAASAREVIEQVEHLAPQVQLADEFYIKAWPGEIITHLPTADYYGSSPMLEDGIGMLRQFIDNCESASWLSELRSEGECALATGEAFAAVLHELLPELRSKILPIKNDFFGGNVDVAGLLTAEDIINQVLRAEAEVVECNAEAPQGKAETRQTKTGTAKDDAGQLILPPLMFNDDGLTLDNKTIKDISEALQRDV